MKISRLLLKVSLVVLPLLVLVGGEDKKVYPRSKSDIEKVVDKLKAGLDISAKVVYDEMPSSGKPPKAGKVSKKYLESALCRLKIYRFLAGLPYDDITLDGEYNSKAQHAAVVLSMLGVGPSGPTYNPHKPPKPSGVPDDFYQLAKEGAAESNIHIAKNEAGILNAIDGFMNDSGPANIDDLGHRRWCLNLAMKRAGFGFNESAGWNYAAMWVDESRDSTPTFDFITFPAKGYHPTSFFGSDWAWSVNVNEGKYSTPVKGQIKVTVSRKSDSSLQPLKLNYLNVSTEKRGASGPCIIFRPESVSVQNGAIYEVEITGLKTQGGQNATIKYLVEFFELTSAKEKK